MRKLYIVVTGLVFLAGCNVVDREKIPAEGVNTQKGFVVEKIYEPTAFERGSWVSLAKDNKNRLLASDQYGDIYRISNPGQSEISDTDIEKIDLEIGHAHGLLYAFNSLYVVVNKGKNKESTFSSGLYRLQDTNNDDKFDKRTLIQSFNGAGEHGPHSIIKGPDNMLYFIAGNHTDIPDNFNYTVPDIFAEDNVLPVIKDPRGHANTRNHPGGWIAKTDSTGASWDVIAIGFRNPYDLAFNKNNDLFTFDSDMEWDMGSPWYRPIRVCHVVEGAEFGWRTGSGKFASYYQDNLGSVVDIGQGSPTGVMMGTDLNFPAKYREGLFIMDWSFGTMYFINLSPDGATYTGEVEEFLSGKPLPLTDMIQIDGDMYFATGGRRLESALYRVSYQGAIENDDINSAGITDQAKRRKRLSQLYKDDSQSALDEIWEGLGDEDKYIRFTARTALEKRPDHSWYSRISGEQDPRTALHALTAAIRLGLPLNVSDVYDIITNINYLELSEELQLEYLRTVQLAISRYGNEGIANKKVGSILINQYPSGSHFLDRELSKILSVIQQKGVIEKTLMLIRESDAADVENEYIGGNITERSGQYGDIINIIRKNNPETRKLGYLEALSVVKKGWTEDQRQTYFTSFADIFTSTGGASYKGFAQKILERALENQPVQNIEKYRALSGEDIINASDNDLADLPKPEGPPRAWTDTELIALKSSLGEGDVKNGKVMYRAALCASCHIKGDLGKNIGPDLTTLQNRFSYEDIITAIQKPSETVSSQYATHVIKLENDSEVRGRLILEENDTLSVSTNPFNAAQIMKIPLSRVVSREESNISQMPPGLLNRLNEKEVKDLMVYLMSGK